MCQAANSNDCMVWCLVEVPAQYKTVSKRVLASAASSIEVTILGKSKTVTKRVMVSSPVTREETIPAVYKTVMTAAPKIIENDVPAQYQTITKTVVDVPASLREIDIPAEYKTVTKRVLVKAGSFSEYREVVCSKNITSQLVRQVQRALLAKGYTVSPAGTDNVLGKDTRAALIKYQKDNGLPVGNTNVETMKHLGIKGY